MKIFGQEGLGRPDIDVENEKESAGRFLKKLLPEDSELPPVEAVLVFTNEQTVLENVDEAPTPTLMAKKLKEFIRKTAKSKPVSSLKVREIQDAINQTIPGVEVQQSEEDVENPNGEEGKPKGKQLRRQK